eukprot:m.66653 g.66653  ORF g.66653 m.66653 type:complete len:75 (-) comp19745_c0_seq1:406-630(-)
MQSSPDTTFFPKENNKEDSGYLKQEPPPVDPEPVVLSSSPAASDRQEHTVPGKSHNQCRSALIIVDDWDSPLCI